MVAVVVAILIFMLLSGAARRTRLLGAQALSGWSLAVLLGGGPAELLSADAAARRAALHGAILVATSVCTVWELGACAATPLVERI